MSREVVILSGVRTAIGTFGGALKDTAPIDLAAQCTKEALGRAETDASEVGHVVFGNVIHTEPRDMYLSRVAMIDAGIPKETPALTCNRLCGSGAQAIVSAAQTVCLVMRMWQLRVERRPCPVPLMHLLMRALG